MGTPATDKKLGIASWVLRGVVALGFTFPMGFVPKLLGDPYTRELFKQVAGEGMADAARYAVGITELAVVVLILIPRTAVFGGMLGVLAMLGAIASHLATDLGVSPTLAPEGQDPASPPLFYVAILLLVLSAGVVYLHRGQLVRGPVSGA